MLLKLTKWLAVGLAVLAALLLGAGQAGLLAGRAPDDLGLSAGRFKPPSATPNSVSSQAGAWPGHAMAQQAMIAPLSWPGDARSAMVALAGVVRTMPGATIVLQRDGYLRAEFRTPVLGFVDDAEFWFDPAAGVIQLRSASRLGRKDLGVNRARIERLRGLLASAAAAR